MKNNWLRRCTERTKRSKRFRHQGAMQAFAARTQGGREKFELRKARPSRKRGSDIGRGAGERALPSSARSCRSPTGRDKGFRQGGGERASAREAAKGHSSWGATRALAMERGHGNIGTARATARSALNGQADTDGVQAPPGRVRSGRGPSPPPCGSASNVQCGHYRQTMQRRLSREVIFPSNAGSVPRGTGRQGRRRAAERNGTGL
jgi:hypothetical protein